MKKIFMTMASVVLCSSAVSGLTAFTTPSTTNNSIKTTTINPNPAQKILNKITAGIIIISKDAPKSLTNYNTVIALKLSLQHYNHLLTQQDLATLTFSPAADGDHIIVTSTVGQYQASVIKWYSPFNPILIAATGDVATDYFHHFHAAGNMYLDFELKLQLSFFYYMMTQQKFTTEMWQESYINISHVNDWYIPFGYIGGDFAARKVNFEKLFTPIILAKAMLVPPLYSTLTFHGFLYRDQGSQDKFGGYIDQIWFN